MALASCRRPSSPARRPSIPGYGLLSENAEFAELCEQCHMDFIGPDATVIRSMGDKDEARRTMRAGGRAGHPRHAT